MRHDDLCGQKVRVLDVVDGLAGGLHAQLVGVDVHGGQLRAGDAGEQRVVEGHDRQVLRDAQSQLAAELFQHHGKDVVADQHGGGVVRRGEQSFQCPLVGIVQGVDLHTVLFPRGDAVLEQGHLIAPLALCGKQHSVADPEIRNAAVSHFIKVIGGFLPGKGVVIVNVDSLIGGLRRLAHNDMEQPFIAQIRRHRTVLFGVEQDKPIRLCVGHHALDGVQHLGIVLPGDDRVHIPPLVAELPDAADDLQMKGVFVDIPLGGGQEIAVNGYFTSVLGAPALNMGVFVGIIAGFVGDVAYNKYYNFRKLPDALAFFNGKRFVPMVVIAYSVVISIVLSLFWLVVQTGINNFGIWIANSSETSPILAPFIYGTLERLLLGIALAMFRRVDADKRANYKSMFISTALAVFLTGVTEPLEFMFMFCAMSLYIVYALLQGCAFAMAGIIHLRLHSFGNLEFITRIPMSLQAGLGGDIINFVICVIAFFVIGYFVAYFMIGKLQLATPGRLGNYTDDNADDSAAAAKTEKKADKKADNGQAERIIALLGGRENIVLVDACMTRLRVTVKDPAKVADLAAWKAEGALSLLVKGDGIQAVYGPKADVLKSDIEGAAVFSRAPITAAENLLLSQINDYNNWKTRRTLGVCAGDVWYYTVHLGWWKDEVEPFAPQWEKLSKAAGAKKTAFLLGDFNSEADVRGEGYDLVLRSGWQDTYRLAQQRDAGYTVVEAIDGWRDAPDAAAKKRIDQIWCSKAVAVKSSRVVFGGLQEPQVSDHAGVMIEL